jgi:dynactin complex subunit
VTTDHEMRMEALALFEENGKLRAEIERLNAEVERLRKLENAIECGDLIEIPRLNAEMERLRKLEVSVIAEIERLHRLEASFMRGDLKHV